MKQAEKALQGLEKCCGLCVLPWLRLEPIGVVIVVIHVEIEQNFTTLYEAAAFLCYRIQLLPLS